MFRWMSLCCNSNSVLNQVVPTGDYYPVDFNEENSPDESNLNLIQYQDIQRVHSASILGFLERRTSQSHHSEAHGFGDGFTSLSSKSLQFSPMNGQQFHDSIIISLEKVIHHLIKEIVVTMNGKSTQLPSNPTNLLVYSLSSNRSTTSHHASSSRLLGGIESPRGSTATFEKVIRSVLNGQPLRAPSDVTTFTWMCDSLELMNVLLYDYPRRTSIIPYITSDSMFLIMDLLISALTEWLGKETVSFIINGKEKLNRRLDLLLNTFISNIHKYGLQIVYQASVKTRYLWCQLVSRICQLIIVSIHRIKSWIHSLSTSSTTVTSNGIDILNEKLFMCTSWMYSLSQAIAVTRYIHADLNHIITVIFWRTGKFLMTTLDELYPANISRIYADCKLATGAIDAIRYNTKMLVLRDTYQLVSSKMIHLFTVTSPAPLELPSEVARFYSIRSTQPSLSPSWETQNQGIQSLRSLLFLSGGMRSKSPDLAVTCTQNHTQRAMGDAWPSSRLKWMVMGITCLIRAGSINLLESRVFLAQRQEWVSAIGEAFSHSLSLGPFYEGHVRDRNYHNQSAAILSSFLMNTMLQLFYGYDDLRLFDSIFWELDHRLKYYCDCHKRIMKRSQRAGSISMKRSDTTSMIGSLKRQSSNMMNNHDNGSFYDDHNAFTPVMPSSTSSSNLHNMNSSRLQPSRSRSFMINNNRSLSGKNFEFTPVGMSMSPEKYHQGSSNNRPQVVRDNLSTISSTGSRSRDNSLSVSVTDTTRSRGGGQGKRTSMTSQDFTRIRSFSIQEDSDSDVGGNGNQAPFSISESYEDCFASCEPSPPARLSVIYKDRIEKKTTTSSLSSSSSSASTSRKHEVITPSDIMTPIQATSSTIVTSSSAPTLHAPVVVVEKLLTSSSTAALAKAAEVTSTKYSINDKVDGNFMLPNGTKRWYPGTIIAVHDSDKVNHHHMKKKTSYDIRYDDGEVVLHVDDDDIRMTKRRATSRAPRPVPTNSSLPQLNLAVDLGQVITIPNPSSSLHVVEGLSLTMISSDASDIDTERQHPQKIIDNHASLGSSLPPLSLIIPPSLSSSSIHKGIDDPIDVNLSSRINSPVKYKPDAKRESGSSRMLSSSKRDLLASHHHDKDDDKDKDHHKKMTAKSMVLSFSEMTVSAAIMSVVTAATNPIIKPVSSNLHHNKDNDHHDDKDDDKDNVSPRSNFSNDSDDNIFAIPSVFDGLAERKPLKRQISNISGSFVPKVQLSQIDHTASYMNMAGGNSLSSALLPESNDLIDHDDDDDDIHDEDDCMHDDDLHDEDDDDLHDVDDIINDDDYAEEFHRTGATDASWFDGNIIDDSQDEMMAMMTSSPPPDDHHFNDEMMMMQVDDNNLMPPSMMMNSPSTGIAMNSHHRHSKSQLKLPSLSSYQASSSDSITSRSKGDDNSNRSFRLSYREDSARLSTNRSTNLQSSYDAMLSPPLQRSSSIQIHHHTRTSSSSMIISSASPPPSSSSNMNMMMASQSSERGHLMRQKSTSSRSSNEGLPSTSIRRAGSAIYHRNGASNTYPAPMNKNSSGISISNYHIDSKDNITTTDDQSSIDEQISIELWSKPYSLMVLALIQRCLIEGLYLDSAVCYQKSNLMSAASSAASSAQSSSKRNHNINDDNSYHQRPASLGRGNSIFSVVPQQVNLLFSIREYLEHTPSYMIQSIISYIIEIASLSNHATIRMLKLLSPNLFQNCLINHMNTNGEKIGDGGFGSVYRVCCPGHSCGRFSIMQKCHHAAGLNTSSYHTSSAKSSPQHHHHPRRVPDDCHYAIKRISRERSIHDQATIYSIYNEVTCLELLSHAPMHGICPLYDYGVHKSEYWLVMEAGGCNLSEWRQMLINDNNLLEQIYSSAILGMMSPKMSNKASAANTPTNRRSSVAISSSSSSSSGVGRHLMTRNSSTSNIVTNTSSSSNHMVESLNIKNIIHCMLLYIDAIMIIQAVHDHDISHFDIKCNNFIIRHDHLDYHRMLACHKAGYPSGALFLTDFGEAIPYISKYVERASIGLETTRCRGTLPIQAPEQLAMSDDTIAHHLSSSANSSNHSLLSSSMNQLNIPALMNAGHGSTRNRGLSISSSDNETHHSRHHHDALVSAMMQEKSLPRHNNKVPRIKFSVPDRGSDIWSLGAMMVELITGIYLFADRPWPDLFVRCCLEVFPPLPLESYRLSMIHIRSSSIKMRLEEVIIGCMKQQPAQRLSLHESLKMMKTIVYDMIDEAKLISSSSSSSPRTVIPTLSPAPSSLPRTTAPSSMIAAVNDIHHIIQKQNHTTSSSSSSSSPLAMTGSNIVTNRGQLSGQTSETFMLSTPVQTGTATPDINTSRSINIIPASSSIIPSLSAAAEMMIEDDMKSSSLYSSVMSLPVAAKLRPILLHLGNALYLHLQPPSSYQQLNQQHHPVTWDHIINTSSLSPRNNHQHHHNADGRRMLNTASSIITDDDTSGSLSDEIDQLLALLGPVDLPSLDAAGIDMFAKEQRDKVLKDLHSSSNCIEFLLSASMSPSYGGNMKIIDGRGEVNHHQRHHTNTSAAAAVASTSYMLPLSSSINHRLMRLSGATDHDSRDNSYNPASSSSDHTSSTSFGSVDVEAVIRQLQAIATMSDAWIAGSMPVDGAIIISIAPYNPNPNPFSSSSPPPLVSSTTNSTSNSINHPIISPPPPNPAISQPHPIISSMVSDLGSGLGSGKISSMRAGGGDEVEYLASHLTMAVAIINYLCHHRNGRYQHRVLTKIQQQVIINTSLSSSQPSSHHQISSNLPTTKLSSPVGANKHHATNINTPSRHLTVTTNLMDFSIDSSQAPSSSAESYAVTPTSSRFTPKSTRLSKLLGGRPPISPSTKVEIVTSEGIKNMNMNVMGSDTKGIASSLISSSSQQQQHDNIDDIVIVDDFICINKIAPHIQRACNQDLYEYLYRNI